MPGGKGKPAWTPEEREAIHAQQSARWWDTMRRGEHTWDLVSGEYTTRPASPWRTHGKVDARYALRHQSYVVRID